MAQLEKTVDAKGMEKSDEFFEISAVSRLTGISSHVLRVWERRYTAVEPKRSETKRRMYSSEDIQRLALLKTLVDNGHAIGSIAKLSTKQLESRVASVLGADCDEDGLPRGRANGKRIALIGTRVRQAVLEMVQTTGNAKFVGEFESVDELSLKLRGGAADIVVYEKDTIFEEDLEEVERALKRHDFERVVYVYHFASDKVLRRLEANGGRSLRAPVDATGLRQACELKEATLNGSRGAIARKEVPDPDAEIPPRAFSDEQLSTVSALNSAIQCECPQHIGHLISGLFAFEQYSEQCENRNEKDAELHAFLHRATAQCRSQMEAALARVLEEEGISL